MKIILKLSECAIECNKMRLIHKLSYDIIDNVCYILSFYTKKRYSTGDYYRYCYDNKLKIIDVNYDIIFKRLAKIYNFDYEII